MNLQQFVTEVIVSCGGMVEESGYALCFAVVPESFAFLLGGRTENWLAFDYEVALENPESEFVNFGGHIVDLCLDFALSHAVSAIRYVIVDRPVPSNPMERMRKHLSLREKMKLEILNEQIVYKPWLVLSFRYYFLSDEKQVQFRTIWMDTGNFSRSFDMAQAVLFYHSEPVKAFPLMHPPELPVSLLKAYDSAKEEAAGIAAGLKDSGGLETDMKRIRNYYDDLEQDIHFKKHRIKALPDEEYIKEQEHKLSLLKMERDRQLAEIMDKYTVKTEIQLDNGILCYLPVAAYQLRMEGNVIAELYYNPVLRNWSKTEDGRGS